MVFSSSCEYGIRAVVEIATKGLEDKREHIPVHELSDELNISFHFLTKTLQKLTEAGLLDSYRGPNGGVRLAKPSKSIFVIDIIEAIDSNNLFVNCILGLPECSDENPCSLHNQWYSKRRQLHKMFQSQSVASLVRNKTKSI